MRYRVVAIEREYATGGREVGEKLARALGVPCFGEEVLEMASRKLGKPVQELRSIEETITGSFLYSLYMLANPLPSNSGVVTTAQQLAIAETEAVRQLALQPCVIVGRAAAGVLRNRDNVLRVFLYADEETRQKRAVETYHEDEKSVHTLLQRFDKRRTAYFKAVTGVDWKSAEVYQAFLNTGMLGIDAVVDMLTVAAR